jgi:hypothetical protein
MNKLAKLVALLATTIILTACGGGSGGGSGGSTQTSSGSGNQATTPTSPATTPSTGTTQPGTGTAHTLQLSWTIPTTRENGSALAINELSGYQVYYYPEGSSAGSGEIVNISGGSTSATQLTINGSGTYYFAIAAVDQTGALSNLSNYVAVTLN